jgi:eukaryotic-like serine/threonine-protein kinase
MAPEAALAHASGHTLQTLASLDVWALGAMAYQAVTGVAPQGNPIAVACAQGVQTYPWEGADTTGAWSQAPCHGVMMACLARQPQQRPSAADVLHNLQRLAGPAP